MDNISYALGMVIADNLKSLGVSSLDASSFSQAVTAVLAGQPTAISRDQAQTAVQQFVREQEAERSRAQRKAGEEFLAANARKEGVQVTDSGLQYEVLERGNGRRPTAADQVRCHYEGRLTDGTVFDSSYRRGEPADFPLSGVIRGWTEGLQLMQEGGKMRFFIPQELGYGAHGAGSSIPPYATLIFDVELIKVL